MFYLLGPLNFSFAKSCTCFSTARVSANAVSHVGSEVGHPACGHKHLRQVPVLSGRKTNCFIYDQVRYVSLYRKIVIIERKS